MEWSAAECRPLQAWRAAKGHTHGGVGASQNQIRFKLNTWRIEGYQQCEDGHAAKTQTRHSDSDDSRYIEIGDDAEGAKIKIEIERSHH